MQSLLDAYPASDESILVPRSVLYNFFFVHPQTIYYLPSTATDKPKSQRKCLPVWDLLSTGETDDKRIMTAYLQTDPCQW